MLLFLFIFYNSKNNVVLIFFLICNLEISIAIFPLEYSTTMNNKVNFNSSTAGWKIQ